MTTRTASAPAARRPGRGTPPSVPGARKIYVKKARASGRAAFYADFREFAAVGGRCEALVPDGAARATTDLREALECYDVRRRAYETRRRDAADGRRAPGATGATGAADDEAATHLGPLLACHLREKYEAGARIGTIERLEDAARVLLRELGNAPLADINARCLKQYVQRRREQPGTRAGSTTSTGTLRIELSLLSDAFARAVAYRWAAENPVPLLPDKPGAPAPRTVWLTRAEAGALLDAAAEHDALTRHDAARTAAWDLDPRDPVWQDVDRRPEDVKKRGRSVHWTQRRDDAEVLLATLLYTGGRIAEVLGLLVSEVDFAAGTLTFRHNRHRRLKRDWHERPVDLWPPLAAVLREHVDRLGLGPDDPLFPSTPGSASPVTRIDKLLARCCRRAGLAGRQISPHALRHTFATALLRTHAPTLGGARVQRSAFDVAKALGHCSSALVDKVYGHHSAEPCTDTLTYEERRRHPTAARTSAEGSAAADVPASTLSGPPPGDPEPGVRADRGP